MRFNENIMTQDSLPKGDETKKIRKQLKVVIPAIALFLLAAGTKYFGLW